MRGEPKEEEGKRERERERERERNKVQASNISSLSAALYSKHLPHRVWVVHALAFSHPTRCACRDYPSRFLHPSLFLCVYPNTDTYMYAQMHTHTHTHARARPHTYIRRFRSIEWRLSRALHQRILSATTRIRYTVTYLHNIDVSNKPVARGSSADALATLKFHRQPRVKVHELYKDNHHLLRSSRPLCSLRLAKLLRERGWFNARRSLLTSHSLRPRRKSVSGHTRRFIIIFLVSSSGLGIFRITFTSVITRL